MTSRQVPADPLVDVLSHEECVEQLQRNHFGRIAFIKDETLHVIPVNYAADEDGRIAFRVSPSAQINQATLSTMSFEIDAAHEATRTGWSVCVHGEGREITGIRTASDDPIAESSRNLPVAPWVAGRVVWYLITPREITGRRLRFHPDWGNYEGWFAGIPGS